MDKLYDSNQRVTVTGESAERFKVLDVDKNDVMFVGGAPQNFQV